MLGVITGSDDHVDDVIKACLAEFTRDDTTVQRRGRRPRRGVPPGRRDDQVRPQPGRERSPSRSRCILLVRRVRQRRRRGAAAAVGVLAIVGTFLVLYVIDVVHRRVDLLAQPHDRARPRPRHRLQPVHRLAVPRGAAPRARRPNAPSCAPCETAGRTVIVQRRSPSPSRSPRCSCSRSRSCGRSPTPASPSPLLAALGAVVVLPAMLAVLGHRVNSVRDLPPPRAEAGRRGHLAPRRHDRHAPTDPDRHRRHRPPAGPRHRRSCTSHFGLPDDRVLPAEPTPAARCRTQIRHDFTSQRGRRARGRRDRRCRPGRTTEPRSPPTPTALSQLPGVARVDAATGSYVDGGQVAPGARRRRPRVRGRPTAPGCRVVPVGRADVGRGRAARPRRAGGAVPGAGRWSAGRRPSWSTPRTRCSASMPLAAGVIAVTTFVLLFLMFGSVVVPIKARRPQRAQPHRHVRRHGVDLPGRPPVRPARLHADRHHRRRRRRS